MPLPVVEIADIPYQIMVVNADDEIELRLYSPDGIAYTVLKSYPLAANKILSFKLPPEASQCGLIGVVVCDEDGNITVQPPHAYIQELVAASTLNDVIDRINLIQQKLIACNIFQPQEVVCTPEPAGAGAGARNPMIVTPEPAGSGAGASNG